MSLLDRVRALRACDWTRFRPFVVGAAPVGWVKHGFAGRLRAFPEVFVVDEERVRLADRLRDFASRTEAVAGVVERLRADGEITGWRDERYPVGTGFGAPPLLALERAAVPFFGTRSYGVHLNGFVGRGEGMQLWVGRRAKDKATAPGKLDHLVAGGVPHGLTLRQTLVKECAEEAGMAEALAAQAQPVGTVSYRMETPEGLRNDVLFCYDLEVPADFVPVNHDGEIDAFCLRPVGEVRRIIAGTEDFKWNVGPVIIDLMIRHGLLAPEDPDYVAITAGLRAPE
jgi:8-oxo-dGTP pyrophosphatase MutT (NUDIX family)